MTTFLWVSFAFLSGAIPFSLIIGQLALNTDIRTHGDHNPGATNVLRAGGWQLGGLALLLDMTKGALPVGLAWYLGQLHGWPLSLVALAPILGHAYSPFLGFKGGKAIATTSGIWIGMLLLEGLVVPIALLLLCYALIEKDGWAVTLTMLAFGCYLLLTGKSLPILGLWAANFLLILWKHRADLGQYPTVRNWLRKIIGL